MDVNLEGCLENVDGGEMVWGEVEKIVAHSLSAFT
jgi:hypothetical protein